MNVAKTQKSVTYRQITESVDTNGVVNNTEVITKLKVQKAPEYVKLYLKDIVHLKDTPSGLNGVLYEIVSRLDYEGMVVINKSIKKIIAERVGRSLATVEKGIMEFSKKQVLIRKDKGLYLINPYLFAKGDWTNIEKIRATISWGPDGRTIETIEKTSKDGEITTFTLTPDVNKYIL